MPSLTITIPQDGPLVQMTIGVSPPRSSALRAAGAPVPQHVSGRGLLDTGASISAIERRVAQQLGLVATGYTLIHTPSTGMQPHLAARFDLSFSIVMDNQQVHALPTSLLVIESDFSSQGFAALIGRDVLRHALFLYHGQANMMSLAF